MLSDKELDKLSPTKLEELRVRLDAAIARSEKRRKREALAAVKKVAQDHGLTLADIIPSGAGAKKKSRTKRAVEPKFKHPENPDITWSGMGRKPRWFIEHLDGGGKEEDLLIAAA